MSVIVTSKGSTSKPKAKPVEKPKAKKETKAKEVKEK